MSLQQSLFHVRRHSKICCCALTVLMAGWMAVSVRAQQPSKNYTVFKFPAGYSEGEDQHKRVKPIKDRVMSGAAPLNQNKAALDQWYRSYFFRSFTHPAEFSKLPEKRQEILNDLKRSGREAQNPVHDYLVAITKKYMEGFVVSERGLFHPAVRFNAMLILGDLNQAEMKIGQKVPNPLPESLGFMVREYKREDQIDAVRVAALIGILRHAKLDWYRNPDSSRINLAARTELANMMIALLQADEAPENRNPDGHVWMQRRAVDILGALGMIGQMAAANDAVRSIVANSERPLPLRCTAAEALGLIDVDARAKVNSAEASLELVALAATAGHSVLDWIDDFQEAKLIKTAVGTGIAMGGAVGGSYGMEEGMAGGANMEAMMEGYAMDIGGMMGGLAAAKPLDPEVKLAQRRLLTNLVCVQAGLQGMAKVATPPEKSNVDSVVERFDALLDATLTPPVDEPDLDGLARNIRKAVRDIEALTENLGGFSSPASDTPPGDAPSDVPSDVPGG